MKCTKTSQLFTNTTGIPITDSIVAQRTYTWIFKTHHLINSVHADQGYTHSMHFDILHLHVKRAYTAATFLLSFGFIPAENSQQLRKHSEPLSVLVHFTQ